MIAALILATLSLCVGIALARMAERRATSEWSWLTLRMWAQLALSLSAGLVLGALLTQAFK